MPTLSIQLGDEIEDVTSKTIGIAVGKVEYLNGSVNWIIQPATIDDNSMLRSQEIPDAYCKKVSDGVRVKSKPLMGFHARK